MNSYTWLVILISGLFFVRAEPVIYECVFDAELGLFLSLISHDTSS